MYSQEKYGERVPVLLMNSELHQAQLDLLSAHCAVHQLRLHYSPDVLVRFGRRDVLRRSAQVASALNQFYSTLENHIPAQTPEPASRVTPQQIAQAIDWLMSCLRSNRERYLSFTHPLSGKQLETFSPYFSPSLLSQIRIAELHGKRVEVPDFFAEARALGFDQLPDIPHLDSLTFLDVIVFNEKFNERALFHGLVHAVQLQVLGLKRYAELWVNSFLKTRAHFTVPLEVQAFALAAKFVRPTQPAFSVENEVLLWQAEDRYRM
jgi:hypothetical protein